MELRKEWREVVERFSEQFTMMDTRDDVMEEVPDLALRLQALADKERREAFEAARQCFVNGQWVYVSHADYLKSQEEV